MIAKLRQESKVGEKSGQKLRYLSAFTGIGGLDMGLEDIGAKCVGFFEIKQSSIDIYKRHYPDHECLGDITKVPDYNLLPDFDIFTGGFPCQSFSLAGMRRGFKDQRGQMIFHIYDLISAKKPQYVVLENVKGLLNHNRGRTFEDVLRLLIFAGYNVRVLLLNAINYGSPQNRERLVFLCSRRPFALKIPEIVDNSKLFRDLRVDDEEAYKELPKSQRHEDKVEQKRQFNYELIGGYDRVGTLTTQYGCGEKLVAHGEWFRYLTPVECERLQGFPDGWTEGVSDANRYFALGNAVSCNVSRYLFGTYLKGLWW